MPDAPVSSRARFTKANPCPICQGYKELPQGKGQRCYGFLSSDGEYAHCTRPEQANGIDLTPESDTFAHYLKGDCKCGGAHGERRTTQGVQPREVAVYNYVDDAGVLVHQTVRYEPKTFKQRRPNPGGDRPHIWSLEGISPVLYRLPDILASSTKPVFVVEGEKDADTLAKADYVATTNPMGAGKWRQAYSEWLRDRHVIIIPDNDEQGRDHARKVSLSLEGIAKSIRVLELEGIPHKGDVGDWISAGNDPTSLKELANKCPEWKHQPVPQPDHHGWDVVNSLNIAPEKTLHLRAKDIRKERTGIHAVVEALLNSNVLGWTTFNVDRIADRRTLAQRCHERLVKYWDNGFDRESLNAALDDFCRSLWDAHVNAVMPEELAGNIDLRVVFALEPYVIEGGGTILFAPPGRGKSWTAILMGVSIDAGIDCIWKVARPRKVLFVNLERSAQSIQRRIGHVNHTLGLEPDRPLLSLNARGKSLADVAPVVEAAIKRYGVEVIVLDSISRAGQGSLIDDEKVNKTMDVLNNMAPTWLALGHTPRGDESHVFGSVHFDAGADITVRMATEQAEDRMGIGLKIEKANDIKIPPMEQLAYEFDQHGLHAVRKAREGEYATLKLNTQPLLDRVIDYIADCEPPQATATDIATSLGVDRADVSNILRTSERFVKLPQVGKHVPYGLKARNA